MYAIAAAGVIAIVLWATAERGVGAGSWWFAALGLLLIAVGLIAARLTVAVDDVAVTAAFGWGWPRRRIELDTIVGADHVHNSWWTGWGLRKVPGGWMFNNAGREAVELTLRSGKVFRIGTDQPTALLAALDRAHTA
jgi:hypothetical protein